MPLVIEENEIASLPITVDPDILGGTPVFRGTRMPIEALLSNLEAGVPEPLKDLTTDYAE